MTKKELFDEQFQEYKTYLEELKTFMDFGLTREMAIKLYHLIFHEIPSHYNRFTYLPASINDLLKLGKDHIDIGIPSTIDLLPSEVAMFVGMFLQIYYPHCFNVIGDIKGVYKYIRITKLPAAGL